MEAQWSSQAGHARVAAGEYSRECLVAELESEAVAHAVGKGFPRQDIPHFLCFYKQCLTLLAPPSGGDQENFPQLITEFKAVTQCYTSKLCRTSMISAVDYITKTLLQHHRLFRFLLAEDQPLDLTTTCLAVESPPDPRPLAEGTPLEEWEKQEQVRKIEEARAKRESELAVARDAALLEMECKLLKAYESEFSRLSDADTMSEGMICSVTDSLATVHVESLLSCITHDLQQSEEEVGFQVAKVQALSPKHTQSIPSPSKSSSKLPAGKSGKAPRTGSRKLG